MPKIGVMCTAGKFAQYGLLWFLGHLQLATSSFSMFHKAPGYPGSLRNGLMV